MITIAISWIIMSYTLFSLGDVFIFSYNKFCKNNEQYNFADALILGICLISIVLPLSSLWLASNQYILFVYIAIGTIHWFVNHDRLKGYWNKVKKTYDSTNITQKLIIAIPAISILLYVYIFDHFYDAEYYHYQQIRWNEEYAVVPGLGNLEDRFGFNSNYLLISAIFTFRFMWGEPLYLLQSLLYVCILTWVMFNIVKSNYDIRYVFLFILFFLILLAYSFMFGSSSTDIIPILCIFYFLAKTVLHPDWLKEHPLMSCLLPITLATFKLSTAVLALVSIAIIIHIIRQKKKRELIFILISASLIVVLWCVRNVIITGYLVYPLPNLDLFSFDWKMPAGTVTLEKIHIYEWAKFIYHMELRSVMNVFETGLTITILGRIINLVLFAFIFISPLIIVYKYVKKKVSKTLLGIYLVIMLCIAFSLISAPDPRFVYGHILGCTFLLFNLLLPDKKSKESLEKQRSGKYVVMLVLLCFCAIAIDKFITASDRIGMKFDSLNGFIALYHHRGVKNINQYSEYDMGDFKVYITINEEDNRTFDLLPATDPEGIPFQPFTGKKIQSIKTIEPRGKYIQDGFRTKKEYIDIINENTEKYIKDYFSNKAW